MEELKRIDPSYYKEVIKVWFYKKELTNIGTTIYKLYTNKKEYIATFSSMFDLEMAIDTIGKILKFERENALYILINENKEE